MKRLLELAERHADWPMPGLHAPAARPARVPRTPPARLLLDARAGRETVRLGAAAAGELPLGSGALAGVNWDLDRGAVARDLGFESVTANSVDAVSNRDFVLDYLSAASICAMHLSRLGAEVVLWSSDEFSFCEVGEDFSSGSSIMPQKKNPDAAELLRAKAPRVYSSFLTLAGVMHGLPLAYSKDLQEDKEALFDAVDNLELCLEAAERMLEGLSFDRERLAEAAGDEFPAATDVADLLVRKGMPFREAHGVVGGLVRDALERGKALSELSPDDLRRHSELLDDSYYEVLASDSLAREQGLGGRDRVGPGCRAARGRPGRPSPSWRRRTIRDRDRGAAGPPLDVGFFDRSVHEVARDLVGCSLSFDGVGGVIVETESYERDDPACHAFAGLTARTAPLFGPPGRAYVYRSYGIHACLNFVCEPEGAAAAVLIRALEPRWGVDGDAPAARARGRCESCVGPGEAHRGARDRVGDQPRAVIDGAVRLVDVDRGGARYGSRPARGSGSAAPAELPWRFCATESIPVAGPCARRARLARDPARTRSAARGRAPAGRGRRASGLLRLGRRLR